MSKKEKSKIDRKPVVDPAEADTLDDTEEAPKVREDTIPEIHVEALPTVDLRVFIAVSGVKPDQMGGFSYYAKATKLGPLSIPKWREAYQEFLDKPVG